MRISLPHQSPARSSSFFITRILPLALALLSCSLFTSCGNSTASNLAKKSVDSIANLIPRRVPVATVRTEDLQKMPSGADRALAWDRHLDSRRYVFFRPKNYKAPKLPDVRSMPTGGGILPPLAPGRDSTLKGQGEIPDKD